MHNIILRDELLQGLSLYMKIYDIENDIATKEDLITKFRKEPKEIAKFLRTSIRKVPGTSTHSKFLRKICLSLLNAKGSPTIFFTVSFANTRNSAVRILNGLTGEEKDLYNTLTTKDHHLQD
jgi:hypothetical protein